MEPEIFQLQQQSYPITVGSGGGTPGSEFYHKECILKVEMEILQYFWSTITQEVVVLELGGNGNSSSNGGNPGGSGGGGSGWGGGSGNGGGRNTHLC